ncbi:MAG: hypothetical protein KBC41_01970 [Candidatus Pacebacteria bacterium]|nr:hypothetical protein [Candidatus Paceibacterota bacterium]
MKKIKVKILGHPLTDTFGYSYFILSTLKKYYDVELSENPDYLFYHDGNHEHYKYNCIKIFYTGENISPNFNICDYAIGFDYMSFEDRYYRMPLYLVSVFYTKEEFDMAGKNYLTKETKITKEELKNKKEFCSFVYSNYRGGKERESIFNTLSSYKKVNSAGSFLNNIDGKKINNKLQYESKHKFCIAFENSSRSGYTTEKIISPLVAKSIPIYWGNPNIDKEFNTKRFINCHEYKSFNDVLEIVKTIDNDDTLYLQMINEPILKNKDYVENCKKGFDIFIQNIIDQPLEKAKRNTINPVQRLAIKQQNILISKHILRKSFFLKLISILYKPLKKITYLEKIKHSFFKIK